MGVPKKPPSSDPKVQKMRDYKRARYHRMKKAREKQGQLSAYKADIYKEKRADELRKALNILAEDS